MPKDNTESKSTEAADAGRIFVEDLSTPLATVLSTMRTEASRFADGAAKNAERATDESRKLMEESMKLAQAQMKFGQEIASIWSQSFTKVMDATRSATERHQNGQ